MKKNTNEIQLEGHCLIAMPDMGDTRFRASLVFICSHSADGAMGLIVNKPILDVSLSELFDQMSIEHSDAIGQSALHYGGPVEQGRGFVLHSPDYHSGLSSVKVTDEFSMTSTLDILEDIARGNGPAKVLFALGYAGWSPGQLESEIAANGWLVVPARQDTVFDAADGDKWSQALADLGIDPAILSGTGGTA